MRAMIARSVWMLALLALSTLAMPVVAQEAPAASASAAASAAAVEGGTSDAAASVADDAPKKEEEKPLLARFNAFMFKTLFFDVTGGAFKVDEVDYKGDPVMDAKTGKQKIKTISFPFLVMVLALGAIFFTFWFRFINLRAFKHAIDVVRGLYDDPDDEGEISHFHALTSALSATVGLGNIAGVAVAIVTGGPGAVVWMMIVAAFGMTAKFSSCTLAQLYRKVNPDGSISGGPMYYLDIGLKSVHPAAGALGKVLAVIYAFMVMGGALGGGNMFQANQTVEALTTTFKMTVVNDKGLTVPDPTAAWVIGIIMAVLVAAVILGGIKRIGAATSKIVPLMCAIYILASILVILFNISRLPEAISLMFGMAFSKSAFYGGVMGVLVTGVQRAAFSNEAGIGSASIAHAAAKTDEPVREGMVAMLGPFIDTIVVCFMTAMVVIITGQWNNPEVLASPTLQGASVTANAFASVFSWFPYVLSVSITLFAYSTMVAWCYYGERGWIYLLDHFNGAGLKSVVVFRLIFTIAVVVGAVNPLEDVLNFSDIMILSMAFPNIIGSVILAPRLLRKLQDYWGRYQDGKMPTYEERLAAKKAT
jgi:alanine or glycine:cation symporter, AGCS family